MSLQAITWALDQLVSDGIAKFVLVVIANHCNHKTGLAFPTLDQITEETSQSKSTVQRKIRMLAEHGLLRVEKGFDPATGRQWANNYLLPIALPGGRFPIAEGGQPDYPPAEGGQGGEAAAEGGRSDQGEVVTRDQGEVVSCDHPTKRTNLENQPSHPHPAHRAGSRAGDNSDLSTETLDRACSAIGAVVALDDAREQQQAIGAALTEVGFVVVTEYEVPDRGDGRAGRIDLVATRNGVVVAIEVDRVEARDKSLRKLASLPDVLKVLVLREGQASPIPGIHRVVALAPGGRAEEGGNSRLVAVERFERFWAAYAPGITQATSRREAERAFFKLAPELQELAIRYAPNYLREQKARGKLVRGPESYLRGQIWQGFAEADRGRPAPVERVFVRKGSPQAEAWVRSGGHKATLWTWSGAHRADGWYFPSEWPPGHAPPASDRASQAHQPALL